MLENTISRARLENSTAGKLVAQLLAQGLLTETQLDNPDLIEMVNNSEPWSLSSLSRGDEIFFLDTTDPANSMIKGVVVYSGEFETLGYNDKTLVTENGVRVQARNSFPSGSIQRIAQQFIPKTMDIVFINPTQKLFSVIKEVTATYADSETAAMLAPEG